jgi:hypothetical protein
MYVSLLNVIATNTGKNFVSKEFVNNAKTIAIKVNKVPVKAHNSISKVEQYYAAICCAFKVISANIGSNTLPNYIL